MEQTYMTNINHGNQIIGNLNVNITSQYIFNKNITNATLHSNFWLVFILFFVIPTFITVIFLNEVFHTTNIYLLLLKSLLIPLPSLVFYFLTEKIMDKYYKFELLENGIKYKNYLGYPVFVSFNNIDRATASGSSVYVDIKGKNNIPLVKKISTRNQAQARYIINRINYYISSN